MKKYDVEIKETLKMTVQVEAENREQAEQEISDRWRNSEFILDSECFQGAEFRVRPAERNKAYER
jgi:hypothetical protein